MKIYFDGCAKTVGDSRMCDVNKRFSLLLCDHLGAQECNFGKKGASNRRIVRNLIENDLSKYDLFVIQMSKREKFEWYDNGKKEWRNVGRRTILKDNADRYFQKYYNQFYSDEMGLIDEKICFTAIKSLLQNKKHVIFFVGHHECNVPVDFSYVKYDTGVRGYERFNEETHKRVCDDIISTLTTYK